MCFKSPDDVQLHLLKHGFTPDYHRWTSHGESDTVEPTHNVESNNRYRDMVIDAAGPNFEACDKSVRQDEPPNREAQRFYDLLNGADEPLYPGCHTHSQLSTVARLLNIKSEYNMPEGCFDAVAKLLKEILPEQNKLPEDFYGTKKFIAGLGLPVIKIDVCVNGCMLYWKENENYTSCKFCKHARFKPRRGGSGKSDNIPYQRMHYLPLTPRLQRLYASDKTAGHMRWHKEHTSIDGIISHPSDGETWKSFDQTHPSFASESRNVRLGLCTDGFTPFGLSGKQYSCWPVMITPYNLPPWMCMKRPYIFLTAIIPGPSNPKQKLDVYLQPLIDELKMLWESGVETYDKSRKQNFTMKAALMWTIGDFPAYGMLSGWSTAGKLSCPICMEKSKSFYLKHGHKSTFFDCHRQFLPADHSYRRNKNAFFKNRVENDSPPPKLTGSQIWDRVKRIPKVTETGGQSIPEGYGEHHHWTKQSIFWELPYWGSLSVRHNLDVMHIIKNVFDNVFNTVMDVKNKTKDNVKARLDLKLYCKRRELEMIEGSTAKPRACYCLDKESKQIVCEWIKGLRFPDGYVSNLSRCVDMKDLKLSGMKSHDCHIFMQRLLPIAFRELLPDSVWKVLTELSLFFVELTSATLRVDRICELENTIPILLCKLEKLFPPAFFNCMEHLPIHLPYEAKMCGPVQYRWMYPFERFLHHLKKKVTNKARVEGSICNAYLVEEASNFCSHYFEPHVETRDRKSGRHDDGGETNKNEPNLSIFKHPGRPSGKSKIRYLSDVEYDAITSYVLRNCPEVEQYLRIYIDELRANCPRMSDAEVDRSVEKEFPTWFKEYVHDPTRSTDNQLIKDLSWGPLTQVHTYPIFFTNGYKFHTDSRSASKATVNSGVCVKGTCGDGPEADYYGILQEIIRVEYPGLPMKQVFVFNCDWFDSRKDYSMKIHPHYKIVDINHQKKWPKYEPFVLASQVSQVYYSSYPSKRRDKRDWWTVCKVKALGAYENLELEQAYQQEEMQNCTIDLQGDDLEQLHESGIVDHVDMEELLQALENSGGNATDTEEDEGDSDNYDSSGATSESEGTDGED